ncbi:MAG: thioredoxin family protein [Hyphomicrobiaceae bacterium]
MTRGPISETAWRVTARVSLVVAAAVIVLTSLVGRASAAELVMFVETGCPWCVRWDREVGEAYARSEEGRIAPLRRVPISGQRSAGVRLAANVTVTPTFVLADGGVEVGRITGYPGSDFFWGLLGQLMSRLAPDSPGRPRNAGVERVVQEASSSVRQAVKGPRGGMMD